MRVSTVHLPRQAPILAAAGADDLDSDSSSVHDVPNHEEVKAVIADDHDAAAATFRSMMEQINALKQGKAAIKDRQLRITDIINPPTVAQRAAPEPTEHAELGFNKKQRMALKPTCVSTSEMLAAAKEIHEQKLALEANANIKREAAQRKKDEQFALNAILQPVREALIKLRFMKPDNKVIHVASMKAFLKLNLPWRHACSTQGHKASAGRARQSNCAAGPHDRKNLSGSPCKSRHCA